MTRNCLWLIVVLAFHLMFSWIGFNPSDEGWSQAIARRMSEGQLPHRDFILCRPALAHLIQVPLVVFGGDYALWLSRLWAWFVVGATCWIWSGRVEAPDFRSRFALYLGAFMLCAHAFSMMAWPTLDGMLLVTLGVVFSQRVWGPVFGGLALLCRQNFLFAILGLSRGSWRRRLIGLAFFGLPLVLYVTALEAAGTGPRLFLQLSGLRGFFLRSAVLVYLQSAHFWAGWAFGFLMLARPRWYPRLFLLASVLLGWSWLVAPGYFLVFCLGLFGAALVVGFGRWLRAGEEDRYFIQSSLSLAWVVGLSVGYNTPAMASGILWLLLWRLHPPGRQSGRILLASLVVLAPAFVFTRLQYPYHDRPALQLTCRVGSVLPGGSMLLTNPNTYRALLEVNFWTQKFRREGREYAIFTDFAVHWMSSAQSNPLPTDCPTLFDLADSPAELANLQRTVVNMPAGSRLLVQKYRTLELAYGNIPLPNPYPSFYPQAWVQQTCKGIAQSDYFYVYESPGR